MKTNVKSEQKNSILANVSSANFILSEANMPDEIWCLKLPETRLAEQYLPKNQQTIAKANQIPDRAIPTQQNNNKPADRNKFYWHHLWTAKIK